ncbi:MAG: ShlB/FhaC/HecB family hemolysin secretion/activation protein [Candidatus Omnitrophica bacterium]|nr:ShlB/FhaC/HecB family hemolysin secretion/activation protein [Candidatus Omnitrophota bacterium]
MRKGFVFSTVLVFFLCTIVFQPGGFSQVPSPQTIGGVTQQEKDIEQKRGLEKKIQTERVSPEDQISEVEIPDDGGPKVMVRQITVEGATLLSQPEIRNIVGPFEGKSLTMSAIQKIADLITDAYRQKGYVTSRAYVPPQTIRTGALLIRVVEGKLGKLDIRGNKYFKTSLIEKKLDLQEDGYFDYSALQQSLVYINEAPDRTARAVLAPGVQAGTTDIIIEVEDQMPIHVGFEYDNYGSRYIGGDRYGFVFEHNNLLGFDDKLYFKYQISDSTRLKLRQFRYSVPVARGWDVGFYYLKSKLTLGKEFLAVDARGDAEIWGLFTNKALITRDDLDVRANLGFDYKRIRNYLFGAQSSRDAVRMLKAGVDIDFTDKWGRNILTPELDIGLPTIFGGMAAKDPNASRAGAGNRFYKGIMNYFRLQPMPWETSLLWKNSVQYTNYNLVASEQFQIGGPTSVRGYPPAEFSGDKGWYTSLEWSVPFYFLGQKDTKVPFTKDVRLYDALRFVAFYDWATTHLNSPVVGQEKHETIRGAGFGLRLNVGENFTCRVEIGYPIGGKTPSDGTHAHPWVETTWKF